MNKKAAEIGCKDTHFVTPNGLYAPGHYSSAYDLCLMARYALRNPIFNDAVNTRKYYLNSRTINKKDLAVYALSKFMKSYPGADGVKSGYIKQAGYCYVGSATRNGWRLVSAVLKSDNAGRDTSAMMDYGFNNFEQITLAQANEPCAQLKVAGGDAKSVAIAPVGTLRIMIPNTGAKVETKLVAKPLEAPIAKGAVVGKLVTSVNGEKVASVNVSASKAVDISLTRRAWNWTKMCGIFAICLVVGGKYGTALTKNSRLRRRRVASLQRGYNRWR
jgi:D-alanyl-D-alanine carboxypeptidase (penicillin-binding protein 5/6)